ncbi:alcohol oxidase [Aureobasidium pullulans]|uniref:Alcohol oxidase n=1 Tax=Aureobasidium pullulans TaxID=5580 RepID=A0A4S9N1S7_AURPU|nr:alcohol oxidase [Aureobasidium pullulans]THW26132.1 alcohol oxidase [Aureobasidium pullulans]THY50149.1 alcohol oxidase [Aureobasidium pullulans]
MVAFSFAALPLVASTLASAAPVFTQVLSNGRLTGSSFGLPGANATYDYVIVGGGLAGSVIATRLSEQLPNQTIAVIEAGSFAELSNTNWSQIPYYSEQFAGADVDDWQPLIDWGLATLPQAGGNGRRYHYAQGKCLGGSSERNQMIYHRSTAGSYKAFADHVGDDAYLFENMDPFFKRSYHFNLPNDEVRPANATVNCTLTGYDIPGSGVELSYGNYANAISSYGPAAFASLGFEANHDFNSGNLTGYGYFPSTIDPVTGLRSSAESGLLSPAIAKSPLLTIYQSCMARNILFDGQKRATGVNVTVDGIKPFTLTARKEVILSAGAYHSPQLLMVSGVGPRSTLEQFNISVISALEGVGQNSWDTANLGGPSFNISTVSSSRIAEPGPALDEAMTQLLANGSGPLSNIGEDFWGWEKIPSELRTNFSQSTKDAFAAFPADWPEFEFVISNTGTSLSSSGSGSHDVGALAVLMTASTSRGNMTIQSASNDVAPVISPNWITTKEDQELAVAGFRRGRQIAQALGAYQGEVSPGPSVQTDAEILKWIQEEGLAAIHHCSALCAMGRSNNTMAVVDSKARVYGVTGLRVIDSSSLPFTPPGHTQGTTYAHAEKLVQDVINAAKGILA